MDEFWILVIVFVIVVIVAVWWVFKKGKENNVQEQVQVPKHYIGEKIVFRNDRFNEDLYSLTVTGIKHNKQLNEYKTENMFVIVSIEWSNLWHRDFFLEGNMFTLKIGNSVYTISANSLYLDNSLRYSGVEHLGAGLSSKFDVVFEIPSASVGGEYILEHKNKSWIVDVEIILKNNNVLTK